MHSTPQLLPTPRDLTFFPGNHLLTDEWLIQLSGPNPQVLRFAAERFQSCLQAQLSLNWEIVAGSAPASLVGLTLKINPEQVRIPQGYELLIEPEEISVQANDEAGIFYAICTLIQILDQCGPVLPCLHIYDCPDFPVRGVMLDISRDKVPALETLLALVDLLAGWKINQIQLYTEHTFAYRRHPEVWAKASPLTGQEILKLDAFCRERFIDLVPNQNSFGHMHRWLVHPRYAPLSEVQAGFEAPWGHMDGPFSLCPTDPSSLGLVSGLYDELLPHFTSRTVNIGCDETFDLGQGRSREMCSQQGTGRVYLEFLLKIYQDLKSRGYTIQYWGDIVLQHPDLIPYLPKDAIALDWGYEADHPFERETAQFEAAGLPFYVCPGTSSWSSLAGRTDNALGNLLNAAENGLKRGAVGYLNTDWGDNGHWQALPVSFLGFAAGAAYSWALEANRSLDLAQALSRHVFRDTAGVMGEGFYRLGNVYKACGIEWSNSSVLSWILQQPLERLRSKEKLRAIPFHQVLEVIDEIDGSISNSKMEDHASRLVRPELILREFRLTVHLLRHACWRGMLAVEGTGSPQEVQRCRDLDLDLQALIEDYQEVWLERNRPGGLQDSVARFEKARLDYRPVANPCPPPPPHTAIQSAI